MWTSQVIDLSGVPGAKRRIHQHVGSIIVTMAATDQRLAELLVGLDNKVPDSYSARVKKLRAALSSWPDAGRLAEVLEELGEYRNRLAHSALVTLVQLGAADVVHGGRRDRTNLEFEPFDLDLMPSWEARAEVLAFAVFAVGWHVDSGDLAQRKLRELAAEFSTARDDEVSAAIDYLFPT